MIQIHDDCTDKLKEIGDLLDKLKCLINVVLVKPLERVDDAEIRRLKNVKNSPNSSH